MNDAWPPVRGPLEWIARQAEESARIRGPARKGCEEVRKWLTDPGRTTLLHGMLEAIVCDYDGPQDQWSVIHEDRGHVFASRDDHASYGYTQAPPAASRHNAAPGSAATAASTIGSPAGTPQGRKPEPLLEQAKRFDLTRNGSKVLDDALERALDACRAKMTLVCKKSGSVRLKELEILPLLRPRFSPCLPLPSAADTVEWRCTASPATWQAMLGLSRAFGGGRPPVVLITGPPGSGKDAYARAVHFGRRENRKARDLEVVSMGEVSSVDALMRDLGDRLPRLQEIGGTLFLDEVDKPGKEARSSLLRVLENREYKRLGRTSKCDRVTFVLAAGKPLGALRAEDPPDFWTRMEVHVPVADPLTAGEQSEREEILREFFKFFWWDAVSIWLEGVLHREREETWNNFFEGKNYRVRVAESLFARAIGPPVFPFAAAEHITILADDFARVLAPHLERRQLSLRGLRSAVGSIHRGLRSQIISMALAGDSKKPPPAHKVLDFIKAAREEVYSAIGTVIQVLPDEFQSAADRA